MSELDSFLQPINTREVMMASRVMKARFFMGFIFYQKYHFEGKSQ
jgi:hypothetical protein